MRQYYVREYSGHPRLGKTLRCAQSSRQKCTEDENIQSSEIFYLEVVTIKTLKLSFNRRGRRSCSGEGSWNCRSM